MTDPFFSRQVENKSPLFTPTLPESFIPRPEHLNRLKALLTEASDHTVVMTSRDRLGGMGKTSLALALTQDETIQAAFPDGILWANLGQDPDILTPLAQWLLALDDQGLTMPTIAMASAQLRHLIKRRRMLLIVDEVWAVEDLQPFRVVEDTPCRLLVTTRDISVPDAQAYVLDEMTAAQAQQFFETELKQSLEQRRKRDALQFAKAVGYLPLSLSLGVLQIKNGLSWTDLLQSIVLTDHSSLPPDNGDENVSKGGKRVGLNFSGLQAFWNSDQQRERQHRSRQNCLKFCLEQLSSELRLRLATLGLFPRNIEITPKMAGQVWDLSIAESRQRLQALKKRGFLGHGDVDAEQGQSYSLHPVMRDIARWLIELPPDAAMQGLGLTWSGAHQQFLERYRPLLQGGQWNTIPDDGYIHSHFVWHLEQAGWLGEIHQLLQEFGQQGRNAWYGVCNRLGLRSNFTVDLARAWQLAKKVYEEAPEHSTGLQVRYALTSAFVRQVQPSLWQANGQANEMTDGATDLGVSPERLLEDWTFTKVLLNAARYLPDLASKVLKSIVYPSTLDKDSKEQTIFELLDNVHQESPDMAVELTEHLLASPPAINALIRLAPQRPSFSLPLLQLLQNLNQDAYLVAGVACLAQIGEHKLHPDLYTLLLKIAHPLDRLLILAQLQDRLPDILKQKSRSFKQDCLDDLRARRHGLGRLPLTYGPALGTVTVAIEEFLELYDYSGWAIALCFERHPSAELNAAFSQVMQSRSEEKRSKALGFLIPQLTENHRRQVWKICLQFSDPECKARILSRILPFQEEALEPLLDVLKLFENQKKLEILSNCLPAPSRLIQEIYATLSALSQPSDRWPYLVRLLPYLSPELFPGLIEVIQEGPFDAAGACTLLKHLTPTQAPIATGILEMIEMIPPVYERATALRQVTPFLPQEIRVQALDIAQKIQFPYARVIALQNFIPDFPEVAEDVMSALSNCHEESPDDLYEALIPVLPENERAETINLIAVIPDEDSRLQRMIRTLPYQPDLIQDIKALLQKNPKLRHQWTLPEVLDELWQICAADLSDTNLKEPRTLELILGMLPLIDWMYSPLASSNPDNADSRFCELILRFLNYSREDLDEQSAERRTVHSLSIEPRTFSQFLDFFCLIPFEPKRAETLERLLQVSLKVTNITPSQWMEWLEKLSKYRPYEFHWVFASLLPFLMTFSDTNTLNQTLQSIRSVREQWN